MNKTVLKFIFVGILNTLLGYAIMFTLYNFFNCNYFFSTAMNYILGGILSFFLNKYFTFQNKTKSAKQIFKFVFNLIICYGIAYGLAKPFVNFIFTTFSKSIRENISMFIGMILFTVLNYFGQKIFVFEYFSDKKN